MASLKALASTITQESDRLASYIQKHDLPNPSFDVDGPPTFPVPADDVELQKSRMMLFKASQDLASLALGPVETLRWQAWNQYNDNISLHAILHYRIAESIPPTTPLPFSTLAESLSLPLPFLTRILRHAMLYHVFTEPSPGMVAHTLPSLSLATSNSVRDWLDMTLVEWGPASVHAIEAVEKWKGSQDPRETGFGLAFGGKTIFEYLAEREERGRVFGSAMGNFSRGWGHRVQFLVEGYEWDSLGEGTVVDIGGSHGHISLAIAALQPRLNFIVQDLPATAATGASLLPKEYEGRISFQAHDMNDPQPVHNADLYLFRSVLLNWPDTYVVKFLRNLIPALKVGARVVINEGVLPERGGWVGEEKGVVINEGALPERGGWVGQGEAVGQGETVGQGEGEEKGKGDKVGDWDEKVLRSLDLCMGAMFNSKERSVKEWEGLFREASRGFKWVGARRPGGEKGGLLWIIEAVWEGETEEKEGEGEGMKVGEGDRTRNGDVKLEVEANGYGEVGGVGKTNGVREVEKAGQVNGNGIGDVVGNGEVKGSGEKADHGVLA